jgi:hypothetical protein
MEEARKKDGEKFAYPLKPKPLCSMPMSDIDRRSRTELLADAAKARRDAARHSLAAAIIHDQAVEETLRARAIELTSLAEMLEARAAKLARAAE